MNTKVKSNSVITHTLAGNVITFSVLGAGSFEVNMATMHADILQRAAVHGMIQRIADKAALGRDPETGKSATPADKFARMKELADHYMSGSAEWSMRGTAGEPNVGVTYEAIAKVKGYSSPDIAREKVAARAESRGIEVKAVLAELRQNAEIIRAIADIKASRVAHVDTGLDDLDAE